ncbi:MAG TPA: class I SAM-dependent methyltransferase [Gemmatimonadales bacterium]|nr:class I SAM-dependent methyltransferase [Gemmatimonadales bacterium]
MLLRPPFENAWLRAVGLRRVSGTLTLPAAVGEAFLGAPWDPSPDFALPPKWKRREHDHPRYARFCYALARGTGARRILEVGSSAGGTTAGWARALGEAARGGATVHLVCVDDDSYEPGVYPTLTALNVERVGLPPDRVTFERGDSASCLRGIGAARPAYFDIYLVDAGHTYEAATADLENGLPAVRPGGLIAVHDVDRSRHMPEATAAHPAPVYDAVQDFVRRHGFATCTLGFIRKHLALVRVGG